MQVEHHELHREFPEYLEVMQALRKTDSSFSKIFGEDDSLTSEVGRMEEEDIPVGEFTHDEMKKVRVLLKDKVYQILVAHKDSN